MELKKISDRIFYFDYEKERDRPILGYVRGEKFSIIIDAGNSKFHLNEFLNALEEKKLPKPKYSLITHWHWDHSFGMSFFNGELIVSKKTNEKLKYLQKLEWNEKTVLERIENKEEIDFAYRAMKAEYDDFEDIKISTGDIIFDEKIELDMGDITSKMILVGGPHEDDSCLIYIEEEKVLFAGDAHSGDYYSNEGRIDKYKLQSYIRILEKIDFETYILAHDNPVSRENILRILNNIQSKL